jgi:hypothetical protein
MMKKRQQHLILGGGIIDGQRQPGPSGQFSCKLALPTKFFVLALVIAVTLKKETF